MRLVLIRYSLRNEKNSKGLDEVIRREFDQAWRAAASTWIVRTSRSAKSVYRRLEQGGGVDADDDVVVVRIARQRGGAFFHVPSVQSAPKWVSNYFDNPEDPFPQAAASGSGAQA